MCCAWLSTAMCMHRACWHEQIETPAARALHCTAFLVRMPSSELVQCAVIFSQCSDAFFCSAATNRQTFLRCAQAEFSEGMQYRAVCREAQHSAPVAALLLDGSLHEVLRARVRHRRQAAGQEMQVGLSGTSRVTAPPAS